MLTLDSLVEMGYISAPFGVHGWVKVKLTTEYLDSITDYPAVYLRKPNGAIINKKIDKYAVNSNQLQLKFENVNDRDQALALRGYTICVKRAELPELDPDEYYWVDLIGLTVINTKNEVLGQVKNLLETGGNDVLVINDGKIERMIPFVKAYITQVDFANRQIIVDWELDY